MSSRIPVVDNEIPAMGIVSNYPEEKVRQIRSPLKAVLCKNLLCMKYHRIRQLIPADICAKVYFKTYKRERWLSYKLNQRYNSNEIIGCITKQFVYKCWH